MRRWAASPECPHPRRLCHHLQEAFVAGRCLGKAMNDVLRTTGPRAGVLPTRIPLAPLAVTVRGAAGAAYVAVSLPHLYRATLAIAIGVNLIVFGMRWPRAA